MMKKLFKMPNPVKIVGRTSSITNSFVNGIIPVIQPTDEEINEALNILGMDENSICCAYCGDAYTEWDHLRPLVINKMATGYVSEIHNLVPACGKCNQSKGNQNWYEWMYGSAQLSPATRGIKDIDERCARLKEYEKWGIPIKIDFETIIGKEDWEKHWENCEKIKSMMRESQYLSDEIQKKLLNAIKTSDESAVRIHGQRERKNTEESMNDKPVGKIVQQEFIALLRSEKISDTILNDLQKEDYSKQIFDVNYPVLIEIHSHEEVKKGVDWKGRNRYYAKPVNIHGRLFLVTSQWFSWNKPKLIKWMNRFV